MTQTSQLLRAKWGWGLRVEEGAELFSYNSALSQLSTLLPPESVSHYLQLPAHILQAMSALLTHLKQYDLHSLMLSSPPPKRYHLPSPHPPSGPSAPSPQWWGGVGGLRLSI